MSMLGPRIFVVGDVMLDYNVHLDASPPTDEKMLVIRSTRDLGGTGANAASVMRALNANVSLSARVGDDPPATWLAAQLAGRGVDNSNLETTAGFTGQATIIHRGKDRQVLVDVGVAGESPTIGLDKFAAADAIYVSYAPDAITELVGIGLGTRVVAGIEDWMVSTPKLRDSLSGVNIVITNEAGLAALRQANVVLSRPVVVTRGSVGTDIYLDGIGPDSTAQPSAHIPATAVEAVDATGAGDCFAAVLVVALAEGHGLESAVTCASRGGAIATTAYGALGRIPTRLEIGLDN